MILYFLHIIAFLLTSRYGIDLKEEDIEEVRAIADSEGEVIVGKEGGLKKYQNIEWGSRNITTFLMSS